jgi:hypothetical protein
MNFCKYKNIFGKEGEGVHSYRLFGLAIVDVLFTILGAYLIQMAFFPKTSFFIVLAVLVVVGIGLHRLFCVRTTVDKLLFSLK